MAALNGNNAIASLLLEKGSNPLARDSNGYLSSFSRLYNMRINPSVLLSMLKLYPAYCDVNRLDQFKIGLFPAFILI